MDKLPVETNTIADLVVKAGSFLGWLFVPGLMKKRHLNEGKVRAGVDIEVENYRQIQQREADILAKFDGIQPESSTPVERAVSSFLADVQFSQNNREQIGRFALLELEESKIPLPEENPLSEDFMIRFYRYASDIGTDEAQKVWAKLLAGEIKQPGTFSLSAMDALRNLTPAQAKNIKTLAPFVFGQGIMYNWIRHGALRPDLEDMGIDPASVEDPSVTERDLALKAFVELLRDGFVGDNRMPFTHSFDEEHGGILVFPLSNAQISFSNDKKIKLSYDIASAKSIFLELISLDKEICPNRYMLSHIASELIYRGFDINSEQCSNMHDIFEFNPKKYRQLFLPMV